MTRKTLSNLRSLGLFLITLAFAIWQKWTAADVAWSMWVASLVGGYALMIIMGYSAVPNFKKQKADWKKVKNPFALLFLFAFIFFFILINSAFLLFHFTAFHLGHAVFLSALLPPSQISSVFMDTPFLFAKDMMAAYWPFAIIVVIHTVFSRIGSDEELHMGTPYISVAKNHIFIFVLAFFQFVQTPAVLLYIVLFYYFYPIGDSFSLIKTGLRRLKGKGR